LARSLFGEANPVGRTLSGGQRVRTEVEVVGVIGEIRMADLRLPPDEALFVSHTYQNLGSTRPVTLLFRATTLDPATLEAVAKSLEALLPSVPVPQPTVLTARIDVQLSEQRILAKLLAVISTLAVLLATVGLYSVIAFTVASRRADYGIRMALGANARRIAELVLRSAGAIVGVGTVLGLCGAYAFSRLVESRLFGVTPLDWGTYVGASILLGLAATLACWIPARTAARTNPAQVLRRD
jgi:ABC-type antimicrobial peptide transport system permease subunit